MPTTRRKTGTLKQLNLHASPARRVALSDQVRQDRLLELDGSSVVVRNKQGQIDPESVSKTTYKSKKDPAVGHATTAYSYCHYGSLGAIGDTIS